MIWIIVMSSIFTVSASGAATIPDDAAMWNENGHYYKAYNDGYSYSEAKRYCELQGGHLATITSAGENSFIADLADKAGRNCYWIGINIDSKGAYNWVTGETGSYSKWGYKEPDNYLGKQGYGFIFGNKVNSWNIGDWGDMSEDCNSWDGASVWGRKNFGFICEWEKGTVGTSIKNAAITLSKTKYVYDGKSKTPTVKVVLNGKTLKKGTDYTVTYAGASQIGTARVYITGKGKYKDKVEKIYTIVPGKTSISVSSKAHGQAAISCKKIKGATGYQYFWKKESASSYSSKAASSSSLTIKNITAGQYYTFKVRTYAKVGSKYYYSDYSASKKVKIYKGKSIINATITLDDTKSGLLRVYNGSPQTPKVKVKYGITTLKQGTDYTVKYSNNTNAGTAKVTITGQGKYTGSVAKTFVIGKAGINSGEVAVQKGTYIYTGKPISPKITVIKNKKALKENTDFKVTYSNNTKAGTASIKVVGSGNYTGTVQKSFTINKRDINSAIIALPKTEYNYTGKEIKPIVTVTYGNKVIPSSNFSVSYDNNKNVGTATIIITGKGSLKGTAEKTFRILEAGSLDMAELQKLKMKFPDRMYWNHVCEDTKTTRGEEYQNSVTNHECAHSERVGAYDCNHFDGAGQCWGFARKLAYEYYGVLFSNQPQSKDLSGLKAGDIVRYHPGSADHSIWITSVSGETVTFVDCNYIGKCQIRWDGVTTKTEIGKTLRHIEKAP